ncbi:hypothetical protein N9W61_03545 [Algibacter sp.]|nr:hypothetical protein [Algibacter sp.]
MAAIFRTPGVYIQEQNAFPNAIAQVETAVPVFIGYTEKAFKNGESLLNIPTKISSFVEYVHFFGVDFNAKFNILDPEPNDSRTLIKINGSKKALDYVAQHNALMYSSIKFFYANGGTNCYIVSVGTYSEDSSVPIETDALLGTKIIDGHVIEGGLNALKKESKPTIIVIPDAVNLPATECYKIYQSVLKHCSEMDNRMAVLDIHNGFQKQITGSSNGDIISHFRDQIGTQNLKYGAAYYPWLHTNIVNKAEVSFQNINLPLTELKELLPEDTAITLINE